MGSSTNNATSSNAESTTTTATNTNNNHITTNIEDEYNARLLGTNRVDIAATELAALAAANADVNVAQRKQTLLQQIVDLRQANAANPDTRSRVDRRQARASEHRAVSQAAQAAQASLLQQLQGLSPTARTEGTELAITSADYVSQILLFVLLRRSCAE